MIQLRIKQSHRTFQCDIAGCRNRTNFLISKRDDVASRPLHLCRSCIRGLAGLLDEIDGVTAAEPAAEETAPTPDTAPETTIITVNIGDRSGDDGKTAEEPEEAPPAEETSETPAPATGGRTRRRKTTT